MRQKRPLFFLRRMKCTSSVCILVRTGENFQLNSTRNNRYLFIFIKKGLQSLFRYVILMLLGNRTQLSTRNPCSSRRALRKGWRLRSGSSTTVKTLFANMGNFGCRRQWLFRRHAQRSVLIGVFEERCILTLSGRFPTFISAMSNCCKGDAEQMHTPADIAV